MKSLLLFLFTMLIGITSMKAQDATANANALASKIAGKMKDSLSLSVDQASRVKAINLRLSEEKMQKRQQHKEMSELRQQLQKVENTRDSLYKTILTVQQFQLYKQKKRTLVSNN